MILLVFNQNTYIFISEKTKALYIYGLLDREAGTTNNDMLESINTHPTEPSQWTYQTANTFLAALDKQYLTLDLSHQASIAFDKLHQGLHPYQNFIADFNTLAKKCKKSNEQKVEALKKKVNNTLALKIAA